MTCGFLIQLVFCKKKNYVVYWCWSRANVECNPSSKKSWIRPCNVCLIEASFLRASKARSTRLLNEKRKLKHWQIITLGYSETQRCITWHHNERLVHELWVFVMLKRKVAFLLLLLSLSRLSGHPGLRDSNTSELTLSKAIKMLFSGRFLLSGNWGIKEIHKITLDFEENFGKNVALTHKLKK